METKLCISVEFNNKIGGRKAVTCWGMFGPGVPCEVQEEKRVRATFIPVKAAAVLMT